jgi:hypothetical protein
VILRGTEVPTSSPHPILSLPHRDPRTGLVVLGAHSLHTSEPTRQVFSIAAVVKHPEYQPTTHANDICLLRVSCEWG